jgi:uncharacterized membrane protein YhhN
MPFLPFALTAVPAAAASLWSLYRRPWLHAYTKALPVIGAAAVLTLLRLNSGFDRVSVFVIAGLLVCAAADIIILKEERFIAGMAAFTVGHLCYIAAWWTADGPVPWRLLLLLVPLSAAVCVYLVRHFRDDVPRVMAPPLIVYTIIITVMAVIAYRYGQSASRGGAVIIGAALFYLSDAVLGYAQFVRRFAHADTVILTLYYSGQTCIAYSAAL